MRCPLSEEICAGWSLMVRWTLSKKKFRWYVVCGDDLSWVRSEGSLTAIIDYNCKGESASILTQKHYVSQWCLQKHPYCKRRIDIRLTWPTMQVLTLYVSSTDYTSTSWCDTGENWIYDRSEGCSDVTPMIAVFVCAFSQISSLIWEQILFYQHAYA